MTRQAGCAWTEVWLPRPVWNEVCTLFDRAVDLVHDKASPPRATGAVKVSMTALLFELEGS